MIRQAYICGSYTAGSPQGVLHNVRLAAIAAGRLASHGTLPICPHVQDTHFGSWDEAMRKCRMAICAMDATQDALVVLPGWERSRGSREEVELAKAIGLPVVTIHEALQ